MYIFFTLWVYIQYYSVCGKFTDSTSFPAMVESDMSSLVPNMVISLDITG